MAAKKRRSRGLSGSADHHASEAEKSISQARVFFDKAASDAADGKCRSAYASMTLGTAYRASANTHAREQSRRFLVKSDAMNDAESAADDAFKKHCLVGGGLSGTRRKSRR